MFKWGTDTDGLQQMLLERGISKVMCRLQQFGTENGGNRRAA